MQGIIYYIILPFIYLISLLPFWLLYRVSDIVFILLFYVFGYRKNVVRQNLRNSFPDKTDKEIAAIQKQFYKYLCDLIFETIKGLTISSKQLMKHCSVSESMKKLFGKYNDNKQSVILVMGHWGNWEWGGHAFSLTFKHQLYVIYHPLSNSYFNSLVAKMRTRMGTRLIAMSDTFKEMLRNKDSLTATAFIADQTPSNDNAYWTTFLNQDTPIFWGVEKIAKKINYPVIYISVNKKGRGCYELNAELLTDKPHLLADGVLSEMHTRKLEADIINNPEIWLWSHRRWKRNRKIN